MKVDGRLLKAAFVTALIIGLLNGITPNFSFYFMSRGWMSDSEISRFQNNINIIRQWLGPIALFLASYVAGKTIDIRANLKATIISIYWRCFTGSYVGYVIGNGYMFSLMGEFSLSFTLVWGAITSLFLGVILFFISYSGIVIINILSAEPQQPRLGEIKGV